MLRSLAPIPPNPEAPLSTPSTIRALILTTFVLASCDGRSDRPETMPLVLVSGHEEPAEFSFVPRYVELRHEEQGWLRYGIVADADPEAIGSGEPVPLGDVTLPPGRYDGIRVGYFEAVSRGGGDSDRAEDTSIVQDDAWLARPFCVDGSDAELVLAVFADHPSVGIGGPTFKVRAAPDCDE